jgi:hypothetical protein
MDQRINNTALHMHMASSTVAMRSEMVCGCLRVIISSPVRGALWLFGLPEALRCRKRQQGTRRNRRVQREHWCRLWCRSNSSGH